MKIELLSIQLVMKTKRMIEPAGGNESSIDSSKEPSHAEDEE